DFPSSLQPAAPTRRRSPGRHSESAHGTARGRGNRADPHPLRDKQTDRQIDRQADARPTFFRAGSRQKANSLPSCRLPTSEQPMTPGESAFLVAPKLKRRYRYKKVNSRSTAINNAKLFAQVLRHSRVLLVKSDEIGFQARAW